MATLIPALGACLRRMTSGEKRLAERLEDKLDDDYLLWYDVPVGPLQLPPDFIVLHPSRGLLILEVKDFRLSTIVQADKEDWTILDAVSSEPKTIQSPPSPRLATTPIPCLTLCADTKARDLCALTLAQRKLPVENRLGSSDFDSTSNKIKVMTMKVSKGLEFPVVALPGVGHMPANGMTRRIRRGCFMWRLPRRRSDW
jgi:hypothetical protein